jgi:hypothetical protein
MQDGLSVRFPLNIGHKKATNVWYAYYVCIIFVVSYCSFYGSRLNVVRSDKSGIQDFFIIKPTRCTTFMNLFCMKLYMFRTVRLSITRSLFAVHSAMVYVIQVCRQQFHPGTARKLSTNLYDIYHF